MKVEKVLSFVNSEKNIALTTDRQEATVVISGKSRAGMRRLKAEAQLQENIKGLTDQTRFKDLLECNEESLRIQRHKFDYLDYLEYAYNAVRCGEFEKADKFLEKIFETPNFIVEEQEFGEVIYACELLNKLDLAEKGHRFAVLQYNEYINSGDHDTNPVNYLQLAHHHEKLGEFDLAKNAYRSALSLTTASLDKGDLIRIYSNCPSTEIIGTYTKEFLTAFCLLKLDHNISESRDVIYAKFDRAADQLNLDAVNSFGELERSLREAKIIAYSSKDFEKYQSLIEREKSIALERALTTFLNTSDFNIENENLPIEIAQILWGIFYEIRCLCEIKNGFSGVKKELAEYRNSPEYYTNSEFVKALNLSPIDHAEFRKELVHSLRNYDLAIQSGDIRNAVQFQGLVQICINPE